MACFTRVLGAISRGESGVGGEFERVVAEERLWEKRREWLVRCWLVVVGSEAPEIEGAAESTIAEPPFTWICEVVRRKKEDIVRLKLEVEPRVERRDSGVPVEVTSVSVALGVVDSVV